MTDWGRKQAAKVIVEYDNGEKIEISRNKVAAQREKKFDFAVMDLESEYGQQSKALQHA